MADKNILHIIAESRRNSIGSDAAGYKAIARTYGGSDFNGRVGGGNRPLLREYLRRNGSKINVICELKPSSPSRGNFGRIDSEFIERYIKSTSAGGAAAYSVLTEPIYFGGSPEYLAKVASLTDKPILMKDFTVDRVQIDIAYTLGASAILIINQLGNARAFAEYALEKGLTPLLEIHDAEEIADLEDLPDGIINRSVIGVNNRNLRTLKTDLNVSGRIIPELRNIFGEPPDGPVIISESGISSGEEMAYLIKKGAEGFLIGTSLMEAPDPGGKLSEMIRTALREVVKY